MNDDKVRLEPDGALKWILLSLFVPFAILVWFYRTNRQINYLNKIRGNDCRVMTPWWLTILAVVFSLAFVIIVLDRSGAAVPSFLYLFASLVFLPGVIGADGPGSGLSGAAHCWGDELRGDQPRQVVPNYDWSLVLRLVATIGGLSCLSESTDHQPGTV